MTVPPYIKFKLLGNGLVPYLGSAQAAGFDLYAAVGGVLTHGETWCCPLGIAMEMPHEMYAQVLPRSSVSAMGALVHTGTIDPDYRGELKVVITCLNPHGFTIRAGDRIAQLVFHRIEPVTFFVADELSPTKRGQGAFGSTGR